MRAAEVAANVFLGVGAFAVAEDGHAAAVKRAETREDRLVVAEGAIAVQLYDIREQRVEVVLYLRPFGMARDLNAVPRREVMVGLDTQGLDLLGERVDLCGEFRVLSQVEAAQFIDLLLEFREGTLELHEVALFRHEASPGFALAGIR